MECNYAPGEAAPPESSCQGWSENLNLDPTWENWARTQPSLHPILFLDVDGVLNTLHTKEKSPHGTLGIETICIQHLQKIVKETRCKLVISSTWRKHPERLQYLRTKLGETLEGEILGTTPILDQETPSGLWVAKTRGDEIQAWLEEHPEVTQFAILDDDTNMGELSQHLIATKSTEGLTAKLTEKAIAHLRPVPKEESVTA
jgi:hypothetical protein